MFVVLTIIYVLVCLFLVLVVLLQQGKGADLAGAFGGGGSQSSFGPRTSTNVMHRLTSWVFVAFVLLSLALSVMSGRQRQSVMEGVTAPTETADSAGEVDAAAPDEATTDTASPQMGPEAGDAAATAAGADGAAGDAGAAEADAVDGEGVTATPNPS